MAGTEAKYDYIVCGGGTCGPVIAGRLSEDSNIKILLLEAGADSADMDDMHMAGAWTENHRGVTDWNIYTPPNAGLNGRTVHCPRGRFIGGSSGCNGTICVRGVKQDYDDWNVEGWEGDEMFRCMRKAENFHAQDWFPHVKEAHGYDGPLHIQPAKCGPLGEKMLESYQGFGLPYKPDMFSTGETANGCGHALRTTWQGYRTTAADYITKSRQRGNVTVRCDVTVDKVLFEKDASGHLKATGVRFEDGNGNSFTQKAEKEVIITSGTYGSPAILLRSGIGPKAELEKLGIECLVDNPNVGENLIDHQLIFTYYELNQDGYTDDARVNHDPNAMENGRKEWKENKTGWLATFPFGSFAFARLNDRLDAEVEEWRNMPREEGRDPMGLTKDQPSLEFFHTVCYGGPPEYRDKPQPGQFAFAMCCFLMGMQSRGKVSLEDANPHKNAHVDHRYMSDRRDLLMMSEGCRFANEVVTQGKGTKDLIKGSWPPGASHHKNKTNADWHSHVQKYASTSYHPVGTCKIGPAGDKTAVVDKDLFVDGVQGLRIADCSIMPYVHSGHTQMPAFGIGEKAAELIKASYDKATAGEGVKA